MSTPAKQQAAIDADLAAALVILDEWHEHAPESLLRLWAAGRIARSGSEEQRRRLQQMEAREQE